MTDMNELYETYVDQALLDEANVASVIKSGKYRARLGNLRQSQYPDWHDGYGAPRFAVPATLFDAEGDRIGTISFDITHVPFQSRDRLNNDAKKFGQVAGALGLTKHSIGSIYELIPGSDVMVFGRETFSKVYVGDLPDGKRDAFLEKGKTDESKVTLYLEHDDDHLRDALNEKGYESTFTVFTISKAPRLDIPF